MKYLTQTSRPRSALLATALGVAAPLLWSTAAQAQVFESGSSGLDGDFNLTGRTGTVNFNPKDFVRPDTLTIDPEGDLVFHFKTITIPNGVTLKMSAEWTNGPVYLLATGNVTIGGIIDLNGGHGHPRTASSALRVPPLPGSSRFPGPGGFVGGLGGNYLLGHAQKGSGPGGGLAATTTTLLFPGWGNYWSGQGGKLTSTEFLVPLIGGSGGGGATEQSVDWWGSGGGAGGGAILIATKETIDIPSTGRIYARGGAGGYHGTFNGCTHYSGGGGGGGSIRLAAKRMIGSGTLDTYGNGWNLDYCRPTLGVGDYGRVRLEAYEYAAGYGFAYTSSVTRGVPFATYVPVNAPKPPVLWISEINGQALPKEPVGGLGAVNGVNEYVTLQDPLAPNESVAIVISGEHLPDPDDKSLIPTLHVFALEGKDIVKPCDLPMADPEGTGIPTCTVTIAGTASSPAGPGFPPGYSRAYANLSWN